MIIDEIIEITAEKRLYTGFERWW